MISSNQWNKLGLIDKANVTLLAKKFYWLSRDRHAVNLIVKLIGAAYCVFCALVLAFEL